MTITNIHWTLQYVLLTWIISEEKCGTNQYECQDQTACIVNSWKCDGIKHCNDTSDESQATCPGNTSLLILCAPVSLYWCVKYGLSIGTAFRIRFQFTTLISPPKWLHQKPTLDVQQAAPHSRRYKSEHYSSLRATLRSWQQLPPKLQFPLHVHLFL